MMNKMIERANMIAEKSQEKLGYTYTIKTNDWIKDSISRTYINVIETMEGTKHYKKYDCGFIDNNKNTYVAGKAVDLNDDYRFDGSKF